MCSACGGTGLVLRLGGHVIAVPYTTGAVAAHAFRMLATEPFVFLKRCMALGAVPEDMAHCRALRRLVLDHAPTSAQCRWCVVGRVVQATSGG